MYLLDTNVISELRKLRKGTAAINVVHWASSAVAQRCASLQVPDPAAKLDSLIAATALVHGLTVVTRNIKDFEPTNVPVLNPWNPS